MGKQNFDNGFHKHTFGILVEEVREEDGQRDHLVLLVYIPEDINTKVSSSVIGTQYSSPST
jgi:hypothetical protein